MLNAPIVSITKTIDRTGENEKLALLNVSSSNTPTTRCQENRHFTLFIYTVPEDVRLKEREFQILHLSCLCLVNYQKGISDIRTNWLFADTPAGVQVSVIAYTIVEMVKANGVNVYHYLTYLFENLPYINRTEEELEPFAPWDPVLKAEIELSIVLTRYRKY